VTGKPMTFDLDTWLDHMGQWKPTEARARLRVAIAREVAAAYERGRREQAQIDADRMRFFEGQLTVDEMADAILAPFREKGDPRADPDVETAPSMKIDAGGCGLCDGSHPHEHPMARCRRCGEVGLAENMSGPGRMHVCKPDDSDAADRAQRPVAGTDA